MAKDIIVKHLQCLLGCQLQNLKASCGILARLTLDVAEGKDRQDSIGLRDHIVLLLCGLSELTHGHEAKHVSDLESPDPAKVHRDEGHTMDQNSKEVYIFSFLADKVVPINKDDISISLNYLLKVRILNTFWSETTSS